MAEWLFWVIAAAVALGSLGLVFAPLWRRAGPAGGRAEYDARVFRDQLREIEADRARGLLTPAEAEATRIEVSRRLIAAADAAGAEADLAAAPTGASRPTVAIAVVVLLAAAGGIYATLGAPGLPDDPFEARLVRAAAERTQRPSQAEVEAMVAARGLAPAAPSRDEDLALVARLESVLKDRPDDLQGQRLLARSLGSLGRWAEARATQARVVALLGDGAAAQDHVDLAELGVLAAGGYVSPESESALARGLTLDATNPVGRYYSGLAALQGGRPDLAHRLWAALLAEGPADAPWVATIRSQIGEVARMAGLPPPEGAAEAGTGPTAADAATAGAAMVARLSERLATQGGPPEDWARLVRSLGVLGRRDEAAAVLAEAREKFSGDPAGRALVDAAAAEAGFGP